MPEGKKFQVGDKVLLLWTGNQQLEAELVAKPQGPGDTLKVWREGVGPIEVNCNASTFEGIWPGKEEEAS